MDEIGRHEKQIWSCKIGECDLSKLPKGGDYEMRCAVQAAYYLLTGEQAVFLFSGWNAELTEGERECVNG